MVSREEVEEAEGAAGERSARRAGAAANDVMLLERSHAGYGQRAAWSLDEARRGGG